MEGCNANKNCRIVDGHGRRNGNVVVLGTNTAEYKDGSSCVRDRSNLLSAYGMQSVDIALNGIAVGVTEDVQYTESYGSERYT